MQLSLVVLLSFYFFFFKQKTAYEMRISDWSSDVCSSDLDKGFAIGKSRLGTPQAKTGGISEIIDVGCPGRRSVEHAGARQQILDANTGNALLRSFDLTT